MNKLPETKFLMFGHSSGKGNFCFKLGSSLMTIVIFCLLSGSVRAQISGQELLRVTRVAQGGSQYADLQYVTARSQGFVNVAPFGAAALGMGGMTSPVEIQFNMVDYQTRQSRRRLTVLPVTPLMGETYLVYDGSQGGGMVQGTQFRVSNDSIVRQWAMMGFSTLNQAADGQLPVSRRDDAVENGTKYYVMDVKFSPSDTIQYWVNQKDFLIYKVKTRFNDAPVIEETRSDYRRVSCLMLPFRVVTKLQGQRLADMNISQYDLETSVPNSSFTLSGMQ